MSDNQAGGPWPDLLLPIKHIIMKHLSFIKIAMMSFLGLISCEQVDDGGNVEYKIAQNRLEFPREGGVQYINVQTVAEVKAVSDAAWCTVSGNESQSAKMAKFAVTAPVNEANESRTAKITVTVGGTATETVEVTQEGNPLYVEKSEVTLDSDAQDFAVEVSATGEYDVAIEGSWVKLVSKTDSEAKFSADKNNLSYSRQAVITFKTSKATHVLTVTQDGYAGSAPEPDKTGMESDAKTLMKKMTLGLNLGNTLEAIGGETAWGAPKTTEAIIKYFKELGFNAVRVPCSWDQNLESGDGYIVKSAWMDRVKEVIDYIVDNDMYAILNIHWDGGWLENDIPNGYNKDVDEQQRAIWTQIATTFRDYDEHLVFAGTNEPNVENAKHMETLLKYEQTFIDAVRATGGRNAYRVLVFQGPSTDVNKTIEVMNTLPTDTVEGRLAAEVHYYTPWNFCGMTQDESWGKMHYFWGNDQKGYATGAYAGRWGSNNEDYVAKQMAKMKTKFWDKGIPVIIGEFSVCSTRNCNLGTAEENEKAKEGYAKSRAAFNGCVVKEAKANGCVPFYWHCQGDLIDRNALKVTEQATYEAIIEAGKTQYPD